MAIKMDLVGKKSAAVKFKYTWKDTVLYAWAWGRRSTTWTTCSR